MDTRPRVYALEDDLALQELYTYSLGSEFGIFCFGDAETFFTALAKTLPDLVLLDIMLPGDDGFAVLARLKSVRETSRIPVVIVSARGEELTKVKGLNLGADDYIAKPFGVLELVARIKANIRKHHKDGEKITFKDVVIDGARHQISVGGKMLSTTLKEYNLLSLLCENAEKVQGREVIFAEVWGEDFIGETRTLDIHIKELRRKLAEANSQVIIQTVRGVGYLVA